VTFAERVQQALGRLGPLCAGIDPSKTLLHQWGLTDSPEGLQMFSDICIEAFSDAVGVIKPQVAFFERHGSAGMAVLERLFRQAREAGLITIADAKRGDIDSTAAAYADAWLGPTSPFAPDAVTVLPYMGFGALAPLFETARAQGRGVFVVARSSNKEGRSIQEARTASGESVEDALLREIAQENQGEAGELGSIGVVVGATNAPSLFPISQVRGIILSPGLGAQGATASDLGALFADCPRHSILANVSRSLLQRGPSIAALRETARQESETITSALFSIG